jgi:hypothetical protein
VSLEVIMLMVDDLVQCGIRHKSAVGRMYRFMCVRQLWMGTAEQGWHGGMVTRSMSPQRLKDHPSACGDTGNTCNLNESHIVTTIEAQTEEIYGSYQASNIFQSILT